MNCQPDDIAIVRDGRYFGHQFAIIKAAPVGVRFKLPNGIWHRPVGTRRWVVESLSGPVPIRGGTTVIIGCIADHRLIPIGRWQKIAAKETDAECV